MILKEESMPTQDNQIYEIPLNKIRISESNVRQTDKDAEIAELAESIKTHGLLQPVVLTGSFNDKPPYELIAGSRRYRAHKFLGKDTIRAIFYGKVDNIKAKIISLSENMHKVELNDADKAEVITALYIHYNKDERKLAKELDLPLRTVKDYIKIEEQATPKAKGLLREGKVTKADVKRAIDASQGDDKKADRLLEKISGLSKYIKSRAVEYGKSNPKATADEIIEAGQKYKESPTIILDIDEETDEALKKAEKQLSMDRTSIATKALSDWLKGHGYLKPK